jgi:hypothetical protein
MHVNGRAEVSGRAGGFTSHVVALRCLLPLLLLLMNVSRALVWEQRYRWTIWTMGWMKPYRGCRRRCGVKVGVLRVKLLTRSWMLRSTRLRRLVVEEHKVALRNEALLGLLMWMLLRCLMP